MAFYSLNSVSRPIESGFGAYSQRFYYVRYLLAFVLLCLALVAGAATGRSVAAVQQLVADAPALETVLSSASPVKIPRPAVAAAVTPVQIKPIDRSPQLSAELESWAAQQNGSEWGFHVQALGSDTLSVGIRDTTQFELASIYKLFLLKPLAQRIPAEAWGNSNIIDRSYLACVQAMLRVSDNPCAEAIAGNLGWSALQRQARSDGYAQTDLNRTDFMVGSAADAGLLLTRLYQGEGYDTKTKQISLDALVATKSVEAIRRACEDCTVYNKTGDFNGAKHDAAIVEKAGKVYSVVIFSHGAKWNQLTQAADIISTYL